MYQDWRLNNQKKYLFKKQLKRAKFVPSNQSDHTHCAFCWEKFGLGEGMSQEGFTTLVGNWWICERCFRDFENEFDWKVVIDEV